MRSTSVLRWILAVMVSASWSASAGVALAATYYVDQSYATASDSNPGTEAQPLKTIQRGVDLAYPGDTVLVKGSTDAAAPAATYNVTGSGITTRRLGLAGSPITIAAYPGHAVILLGNGSSYGINLDYASFHTFRGITFKNFDKATESSTTKTDILIDHCEFTQTYETGLRLRNITNLTMRDCYVHHCFEAGISVRGSTNVVFERVESSYNDDGEGGDGDGDGFHSLNCGTMTFTNCTARGNSEDGFDLTANAVLSNCVSISNNVCGMKLWRRTDDGYLEKTTTVKNSVFCYNGLSDGDAGIKVSAGARLNLYNSVVYGSGAEGVAFRAISITQGPATVTSLVTDCIIAGNGCSQTNGAIEVLQSGAGLPKNDVKADHNLYFNNSRNNIGLTSDTNALVNQDPLFVAPASEDFHLTALSPAIDRGIPIAGVTTDFDHHARPYGAAPDIGAYEYMPSAAANPPKVTAVTLNNNAGRSVSAIEPSGIGVQTVTVKFSKPVTFDATAVVAEAVSFVGGVEAITDIFVPRTLTGSGTDTMTLEFDSASIVDTWLKITILGDGSLHDDGGQALDGEPPAGGSGRGYLYSAAADLPSGSGTPGSDAIFYVGSLRGDFNGDGHVTTADEPLFMAAWNAKSLDADFRGVGFGVRPPDGKITVGDIDGFTSVYKAAMAAGRHLDPLPD